MKRIALCLALLISTAGLALGANELAPRKTYATQTLEGTIVTDAGEFSSWAEYVNSSYFRDQGLRCGAPVRDLSTAGAGNEPTAETPGAPWASLALESTDGNDAAPFMNPADCTFGSTNPAAIYDPSVALYRIPVVVHVIQNTSGSGFISEAMVADQIDILNEDFRAILGSNGQNGTDIQIEFFLATEDPSGNPTNGITYSTNNTWFNDGGSYWNTLAWDTARYMNIYTNTAGGNLGYVPDLPQSGHAGNKSDRVVVLWESFGRNSPIGPPFDQGRTTTHEVGHYLGLEHTFNGGCGSVSACYTTGDLICDTNPQQSDTSGCGGGSSCGSPDPTDNYMDYSNDVCMERFTPEQARRMRCSLENYRADLATAGGGAECGNGTVESGETCDDGNTTPGDGCDADCQIEPECGNGTVEPGEGCDDGNTTPGDGCDASCQIETFCGNGIVETGEQCEPPNTSTCDASCQRIAVCGDGVVDPGEQCDDGNTTPQDGCSALCQNEGPAHDCCDISTGPGCSDASIQGCVCAADPYCCNVEWDDLCVDGVEDFGCGACTGGGQPGEVSGPASSEPLSFSAATTLSWENAAASGSESFNLYRGDLSELATGSYGSCVQSGLGAPSATAAANPQQGEGWFYLVTGRNAAGEGPLGLSSAGSVRATSGACP